jgi:deoxyuridine 5'-triphosphate nucleotidohydrolase
MNIPIKLFYPESKVPTQSKRGDAGYDLYCCEAKPVTLYPNERYAFSTGVGMSIPLGYYGRIAGRSGLAIKGIDVLGGIIDHGYTGLIKAILINDGPALIINPGDRIAQLIIEACHSVTFVPVDYLDDTERGVGGFGSTGS